MTLKKIKPDTFLAILEAVTRCSLERRAFRDILKVGCERDYGQFLDQIVQPSA